MDNSQGLSFRCSPFENHHIFDVSVNPLYMKLTIYSNGLSYTLLKILSSIFDVEL